jgi:hypothetical protein
VLILDAAQPDAGVTGMIDLSDLDPDDGIPNCSSLTIAGGRLYVTCQILDDEDAFLTPRGAGKLAVVDLADDSLVTTIDMQHANPLGFVYPSDALGGDLVVATVPSFADLSEGCVERISVSDTPTISCLVTNEELGGYASSVAETDDGELVFAVTEAFDDTDFGPIGFVITYDTAAGSLSSSPMTPTAQRPFDVAVCPTGHIALADAGGGIRIYEGGDELTTEPLDIGLPPVARGLTCY